MVVAVTSGVRRVWDVVGFDRFFPTFRTAKEATTAAIGRSAKSGARWVCLGCMMLSSNSTFVIWEQVKKVAQKYANSDKPLPEDEECDRLLSGILAPHYGADIPRDAFEFYATELCSMISDMRRQG